MPTQDEQQLQAAQAAINHLIGWGIVVGTGLICYKLGKRAGRNT